jgi:hypothetical protein
MTAPRQKCDMDMTNKRFGRLTTVHTFIRNGRRYWHCACDCGAVKDILQQSLKDGESKSCGCYRKELGEAWGRDRALPNNGSAVNDLVYKYKLRAKKESIEWNLSKERCEELFQGICEYCGAPPSKTKKTNSSVYVYNGIDRVDNSRGYVEGNVVSCCTRCNYMKSDLSLDDFYKHVINIYKRMK